MLYADIDEIIDGTEKPMPLPFDCPVCGHKRNMPMTNADRIRAMTDEKLAAYLVDIGFDCHLCSEHRRLDNEPLLRNEKCDERCEQHCLKWLQQPAEGDA